MKTLILLLLVFGAAAASAQAPAPASCSARYAAVHGAALLAFDNAPWTREDAFHDQLLHDQLLDLASAATRIEVWLQWDAKSVPADVCGARLRQAEAMVMVWREKGWLPKPPTAADDAAVERRRRLRELDDALAALSESR